MLSRKVVLVGWDAADWKVIRPLSRAGKMPHLARLLERGSSAPISTLYPPLSPMLWTSIATGKRPFKHGIHGFSEPSPDGSGVQPVTNLSRTSKAVWNILHQSHLHSIVVGWWPSHPAEPIDGVMLSDHFHRAPGPLENGWPLRANSVHPRKLGATLAALRTHPDALTPEMVEPFVPFACEIDQDQDKRLGAVLRTIAECMSIQSAALWLIQNRPWDFFAVYFDAIDHFSHGFMRYHPPRQPWIAEADFRLYSNVVSAAYELHDRMLGALVEKAGEDAIVMVVSDHGFHPDHLRPASIPDIPAGPAVEHRDFGIFAIAGPGIEKSQPLCGPSVLDIAPTILALFGLPAGEDMDGRVLSQALAAPAPERIPSWEDVAGADGRHPPHTRIDPVAAHEALERMIALGYIERPGQDRDIAARRTVRELRYNLAESYQDAGRHAEALEILRELCAAGPDEQRFAVRRFVSAQALAHIDEMREIAASPLQPLVAAYLNAHIAIAERRYSDALNTLQPIAQANPQPALLLEIGRLLLRSGRLRDAARVYRAALELDPDSAQAHIGLCRIALKRRKFADAAHFALGALERVYRDPASHFLLGRALEGAGDFDRASEAFRAALALNPNFPEAHLRLAALLEHQGDVQSARKHRRLAHRMKRTRSGHDAPAPPRSPAALDIPAGARPLRPAPAVTPRAPGESVIVVTGLPRSGTSMLMQMLAAAGVPLLTDSLRLPDQDNPLGYFEFEPAKNLFKDSRWLARARGQAVKIVAALMFAVPQTVPCRVILCERDLDEVLDSQERMLARANHAATTPLHRHRLKAEYARTIARLKSRLARRAGDQVLTIDYSEAISNPLRTAEKLAQFLDGHPDPAKMAAAVDPALYRNRSL